jgi:hypothetical protein
MVGLIIVAVFVVVWIWIFYQLYKAPQVDDNDEIIEENDSFLDFEEDEEFLN